MNRQYVHLSIDIATAEQVGRRKSSSPVILKIKAKEALLKGINFYFGNEQVWLSYFVPSEFIVL